MVRIEPQVLSIFQPELGYDDKILVNGGGSGIGLAVATMCAEKGATVVAVSRHKPRVPVAGVSFVQADMTKEEEINKIFDTYGPFNYVFNNIGIYEKNLIEDTTSTRLREVLEVNVVAMFLAIKAAMRNMRVGGVMVNMSSRPTLEHYHSWATYTLSKNAVITMTKAAAEEGNIFAYAVCPSRVDTKFRDEYFKNEDKNTRLSPEQVARFVLHLFTRTEPNGEHYWLKKV